MDENSKGSQNKTKKSSFLDSILEQTKLEAKKETSKLTEQLRQKEEDEKKKQFLEEQQRRSELKKKLEEETRRRHEQFRMKKAPQTDNIKKKEEKIIQSVTPETKKMAAQVAAPKSQKKIIIPFSIAIVILLTVSAFLFLKFNSLPSTLTGYGATLKFAVESTTAVATIKEAKIKSSALSGNVGKIQNKVVELQKSFEDIKKIVAQKNDEIATLNSKIEELKNKKNKKHIYKKYKKKNNSIKLNTKYFNTK